jgi:hypothetical protein
VYQKNKLEMNKILSNFKNIHFLWIVGVICFLTFYIPLIMYFNQIKYQNVKMQHQEIIYNYKQTSRLINFNLIIKEFRNIYSYLK